MPYMLSDFDSEWAAAGAPAGVVQPGEFGSPQWSEWSGVSGHPYQYSEGGIVSAFGTYAFGGLPASALDPKMPLEARWLATTFKVPLWVGYGGSIAMQTFVLGGILTLLDPLDLYRGGIIPDWIAREHIAPAWGKFQKDIKSKPPLTRRATEQELFLPI